MDLWKLSVDLVTFLSGLASIGAFIWALLERKRRVNMESAMRRYSAALNATLRAANARCLWSTDDVYGIQKTTAHVADAEQRVKLATYATNIGRHSDWIQSSLSATLKELEAGQLELFGRIDVYKDRGVTEVNWPDYVDSKGIGEIKPSAPSEVKERTLPKVE
jgi:hypothetical protein